jgi:hypothetical protein
VAGVFRALPDGVGVSVHGSGRALPDVTAALSGLEFGKGSVV